MKIYEEFLGKKLPDGFYWFNEPARYHTGNGLELFTYEKTDFWQKTHYGFSRDNGHCLLVKHAGDFRLETQVNYEPAARYDQCGLMIRSDENHWIKVSTEYENERVSRLGSVVTNFGYSDWATRDVTSDSREMWYRISRWGNDFLIESSFDDAEWSQMRISHLHRADEILEIGIYACSPTGKGFSCRFISLKIDDNAWFPDE